MSSSSKTKETPHSGVCPDCRSASVRRRARIDQPAQGFADLRQRRRQVPPSAPSTSKWSRASSWSLSVRPAAASRHLLRLIAGFEQPAGAMSRSPVAQ